jgi:hypothetical protein
VNLNFLRGDLVEAEEHFGRWSGFLDADGFGSSRRGRGSFKSAVSKPSLNQL